MKLKRLVAGVLSAAMMLSIGSTMAFADESTTSSAVGTAGSFSFTSTMYLGQDAISAPNVTYTYTLSIADGATAGAAEKTSADATLTYGDDLAIYTGILTGVTPVNSDAEDTTVTDSFTTNGKVVTDEGAGTVYIENTVTGFDFTGVAFPDVGVYHYILTESSDSKTGLINETDLTRDVYVMVEYDGTTSAYVATQITMTTEAIDDENFASNDIKSAGFIHSYGISGDGNGPYTDATKSQDFVVTLTAFGKTASRNLDFAFATVSGTGIDDGMTFEVVDDSGSLINYIQYNETANTFYTLAVPDVSDSVPANKVTIGGFGYASTNIVFTYDMMNGETFTILGVVEDMEFTVSIDTTLTDYSYYAREYDSEYDYTTLDADATTAWVKNTGATGDDTAYEYVGKVDGIYTDNEGVDFAIVKGMDDTTTDGVDSPDNEDDDKNIEYDATLPSTGVVLDLAPYAIMMVLAAGFITFRAVRKTEE